jgi:L-lactate dehydrogenase complex protein LldG
MGAREDILGRVRKAVKDAPQVEIERGYRTSWPVEDLVGLFADRAGDYRADVRVVAREAVEETIARLTAGRAVIVPDGLPYAVPDPWTGPLEEAGGVVTACAVAIAETGTVVLDCGPGQGRRAQTLVPDHHVCVVRSDQIVAGVPEALTRLDPARPLTWISGPSATSDIELNRVEGVHGPRTLAIVVVT